MTLFPYLTYATCFDDSHQMFEHPFTWLGMATTNFTAVKLADEVAPWHLLVKAYFAKFIEEKIFATYKKKLLLSMGDNEDDIEALASRDRYTFITTTPERKWSE